MKVKIFKQYYPDSIEIFINKFLQDNPNIEVIDIKLSPVDNYIVALIIYRTN